MLALKDSWLRAWHIIYHEEYSVSIWEESVCILLLFDGIFYTYVLGPHAQSVVQLNYFLIDFLSG